ncbi:MAG: hypothetical protein ACJ0GY_09075 [Synechococcus sp.]
MSTPHSAGFLEQRGEVRIVGKLSNNYIWRVGAGNYQAEQFESENLTDLWRANFLRIFEQQIFQSGEANLRL